jgi:DNA-binding CsgD family transcriptional regulator
MCADPKASPSFELGDAFPATVHEWIDLLPTAAWLADDLRFLSHANAEARRLLGLADGQFWRCPESCPVCGAASAGRSLEPRLFQLPQKGERWVRVFGFPLGKGARIHCAIDATREKKMASYLQGLSAEGGGAARLAALSPRERQILAALADAAQPDQIARRLHLSTITVRNHIQHILRKLGLHSTQAAVAEWLLESARERLREP